MKKNLIIAIVLTFATFLSYVSGLTSSVFGGDSGDIILSAFYAGVAHPPGYPLNSLIGWFFARLPYEATIAYKVNLMQAVFMSFSVGFLFLSLRILTKNTIIGIAGALSLAFNPLFWLYAHIAEVFQLAILLESISLLFLFMWWDRIKKLKKTSKTSLDKNIISSVIFLGLAVFHHHTFVLLLPAHIYFINKNSRDVFNNRKSILRMFAVFLVGFLPYIAVPLLASQNPPVNWDNPVNIQNFIQLITRADYGSFTAAPAFAGIPLETRLVQLVSLFAFVKSDFTIIGLIIIAVGAIYVFFKEKVIFWFLTLAIFFTGPFFLLYSSFDLSNDFFFAIWERFVLITYFFLAIFLSFGFVAVYTYYKQLVFKRYDFLNKPVLVALCQGIFLLFPFYMYVTNYSKTNLSQFKIGDFVAYDTLNSAEKNSIIFMADDTTTLNTEYIYHTTSEFKDKKLIVSGFLNFKYYREQLLEKYPEIIFPANFIDEYRDQNNNYVDAIIHENYYKFPIYSVSNGLQVNEGTWVARGLLFKLQRGNLNVDQEEIDVIFSNFKFQDHSSSYSQFMENHIKNLYYSAYLNSATTLSANNYVVSAVNYAEKAIKINPKQNLAYIELAKIHLKAGNCNAAKSPLFSAYEINKEYGATLDLLVIFSADCEKNEEAAKYYANIKNGLLRNLEEKLN